MTRPIVEPFRGDPEQPEVQPERSALLELAAECMWRRDYPNGGSVYKTYDSLNYADKELHRAEAMAEAGVAFGVPPALRPAIETILAEEVTCGTAGAPTAISYGASVERLIALLGR